MIILGIDTTADWCSAALVDEARVLASESTKIGWGHAEVLGGQVRDLLTQARLKPTDIDKISVCVGPGSFTGLRVGLSFAKGFALPHNIPIVGMSALYVWAASADPSGSQTVMAVANVKRGQILAQVYQGGTAKSDAILTSVQEIADAGLPDVIVGGGASLLGLDAKAQTAYVNPAILAWLGVEASPQTNPADPLYHRPPDAKLPGGKALAQ